VPFDMLNRYRKNGSRPLPPPEEFKAQCEVKPDPQVFVVACAVTNSCSTAPMVPRPASRSRVAASAMNAKSTAPSLRRAGQHCGTTSSHWSRTGRQRVVRGPQEGPVQAKHGDQAARLATASIERSRMHIPLATTYVLFGQTLRSASRYTTCSRVNAVVVDPKGESLGPS
jgi:hypothetical protein